MLRVIICDDRPDELENIKNCCEEYFATKEISAEILSFTSPLFCIEKAERLGGCDIALLDICMPGISGIELAKEILRNDEKTQIAFVTTSDEFAVQAFSLGAANYITKPFTPEEFAAGMDRIIKKINVSSPFIFVTAEGGAIHKIETNNIQYIEGIRNGQCVNLCDGKTVTTRISLGELSEKLEALCPGEFVSPHRGFIVNFGAVVSITAEGITLKSKK